jgi:hypothetical protein
MLSLPLERFPSRRKTKNTMEDEIWLRKLGKAVQGWICGEKYGLLLVLSKHMERRSNGFCFL